MCAVDLNVLQGLLQRWDKCNNSEVSRHGSEQTEEENEADDELLFFVSKDGDRSVDKA